MRQSRPDTGLGLQVNKFETLQVVPSSLGSGHARDSSEEGVGIVFEALPYRGTSLIRNSDDLGPFSRTVPRALWWS